MRIFDFEEIDETLPLLPLAARRALDGAGRRLSLAGWRSLDPEARRRIVEEGGGERIDVDAVKEAIAPATPPAEPMVPDDFSRLRVPPHHEACAALWPSLDSLERFALAHQVNRGDEPKLAAALAEIGGTGAGGLTHLDERGAASMVDVGEKNATARRAVARARVAMRPDVVRMVRDHSGPKGDVLATARVAGIMAAKRTPELIPLCHGIALTRVTVSFEIEEAEVSVWATADARDRTGVEMEAMVAASVAALTIYDMLKAVQRDIAIEQVVLAEKEGGRSGHYRRESK